MFSRLKMQRRRHAAKAETEALIKRVASDTGNPEALLALATHSAKCGRPALAHALERSSQFLAQGAEADTCRFSGLTGDDLLEINHNQYYRFLTLQQAVRDLAEGLERPAILDIGGGGGELASFLPECDYFLADPGSNGISSDTLPFSERAFDFVVACHVLEHIPRDQRWTFLDGLAALGRRGLVLLNPFHNDLVPEAERLELIVHLTDAEWAKEHIECILPKQAQIEDWAAARGHTLTVEPNGTMAFTLTAELMHFYMRQVTNEADMRRCNRHLNQAFSSHIDNDSVPTALLIKVALNGPKG